MRSPQESSFNDSRVVWRAQRCLVEGLKARAEPGALLALLALLPEPPAEAARGRRPNAPHLEESLALALLAEVRCPGLPEDAILFMTLSSIAP